MSDPVVKLKSGSVRGCIEKHEDGFDYYAFKGIPYAEPPLGELRFEDPVAKKEWDGIVDCKNYSLPCLQYDVFFKTTSLNEDCLYLNVFTRAIGNLSLNNPVIVLIHGGGYICGSSDDLLHGPDYLIRKDIVFVTVSYRIGVLGFLNLEDEVNSGNQGMKDMVLALQWIQQNIRVFGGDPGNVTVYGAGAGGASAHYLALSPMTKGLMHKMIANCASVFTPWVSVNQPKSKAIKLCSLLGQELKDSQDIMKYLKTVDAEKLLAAQKQLRQLLYATPFAPGTDIKSPNPFLPYTDLHKALDQGIHLPYLIGYNAHEGIQLLSGMTRKDLFQVCDSDFENFFKYNTKEILKHYDVTAQQIRRFYFKNEAISGNNLESFVDCLTDIYFVYGVQKSVRMQAEHSSASTYLFKFSFESSVSFVKVLLKDTPLGAGHMDDMLFLFKMRIFEKLGLPYHKKDTKEYRLMEQMTEMWANFARYGRPTVGITDLTPVHWKPVADGTVLRCLNVDEDFTMQSIVNVDQKFLSAKDIKV